MVLLLILLITTLIMKQYLPLLMIILTVSAQISPFPPCLQYLSDLQSLYNSNRAECNSLSMQS